MSRRHCQWIAVSLACLAELAGGCGGDGITRHPVAGKVTYLGAPVQDGAIVFEPDASVGAVAPTSFARIENGGYQTARAESPTTGKYKVRVMGYDKSKMKKDATPGEIIEMPELFPEYALEAAIPVPGGKLDIDVPAKGSRASGR
jgi:hypothetical protein